MIDDDVVTAGDAAGKAVVFISDTAVSTVLGSTMRDVFTPVIVSDSILYDDMAFTGLIADVDYGNTGIVDTIDITNPAHPMAAGLSGVVTIHNFPAPLGWGVPSPNAEFVATTTDGTGHYAIFGYETGALMVGMNAPARRVGFFFAGLTAAELNGTGWQLFDAAVMWATGP